ncbi:MAG: hypothetical protein HYY03_04870, partial [Chloroflexi bacterium]|nr:hypothetical protein [Chloroflexota bacterium]
AVQGALPSGGGGTPTAIKDADQDTRVEVEASPDEDKIRLTVAAVETLLIQTATPHVKATGYVRIYPPAGQSNGGLGIGTDADSTHPLSILATGTHAGGVMQIATLNTSSLVLQGSVASLVGLYGLAPASVQNATTGHIFQGLNFAAIINGADAAAVAADLTGCRAQAGQFGFKGTITLNRQFYAPSPYNVAPGAAMSFTLAIGYDADDQGANSAKVVDAISYRAAEIKGNTGYRRLLELGKNPELRLESGDPSNPGADKGRSQLLLTFNENGVIAAVRRIEWKLQSTLVAGDKVLVAV